MGKDFKFLKNIKYINCNSISRKKIFFFLFLLRCQITKEDMAENDFAALSCAQNLSPERFKDIPETCEQVLWRFKMNLTESSMFLDQIEKACSRDVEKVNGCKNRYPGKENAGHYMSCLIDEKFDGGLKPACEDFLTQVLYIFYNSFLKMTLIFF